MSSRDLYSKQAEKIISKEEYSSAKKIVEKYLTQQAKIRSGEYYKKGKEMFKAKGKDFGSFIKKVLTTK